jgi:hypothetical protein
MANQQKSQQRGSAQWSGHTIYTTVEEIPTGEEVLAGTFFLNEHPINILFDSGASHDFVSFACAERARLTLVALGAPYVISTPGGWVDNDRIAQNVPLELSRRVISTNLIVLSGRGIDVILGMRWMKLHKVVLDIAARLVHLYSPVYGVVTLHLLEISCIRECLHNVVERTLEDIQVVREFPDVFPEDLLGMPPEGVSRFSCNPVGSIQDVTSWVDGMEDTTLGFARQRFYPPKFITLGLSGIVCVEES